MPDETKLKETEVAEAKPEQREIVIMYVARAGGVV